MTSHDASAFSSRTDCATEGDKAADIALVIHALTGGGSEHAAARMASHWAEQGRRVTLITLDRVEGDTIELHPSVRRIGLGLMNRSTGLVDAVMSNWRRIRALRNALRSAQPRHVVSLTDRTNVLTLLACRGTQWQPVVAERTDPRHHQIGGFWNWLRRRTYPRAKAIVVQTESVARVVQAMAGSAPVVVIPNGIDPAPAVDEQHPLLSREDSALSRGPCLAALGRLSREKGFDLLIAAFAQVAGEFQEWKLVLVGDGPERHELELLITESQLQDRVWLPGWCEAPWAGLRKAAIFVMPSRYEGFPNALLEAMAAGVSSVAFDCPSGPSEIIRSGENGLLVPAANVESLASALRRLMSDAALRERLGAHGREVVSRFSVESHFRRWDEVLGWVE